MKRRVLIAEDESNIVESLRFLMQRADFDVLVATDGHDALAQAIDARPDVMVLDVMLPGIDGYEVLRQLRANEHGKSLPVLMLTAKGQRVDRQAAIECGASHFMTKPFSNSEIVQTVTTLAEGEQNHSGD